MKTTVRTLKEISIPQIRIVASVNYDDEEIPNDFPFRIGDTWSAVIDIDSGVIKDWPGLKADMHLTVKDCASYYLIGEKGNVVASRESNYVPHGIVPGKYGDTIELKIEESGKITNWPTNPDVSEIIEDED